jgi:hypothetical protein
MRTPRLLLSLLSVLAVVVSLVAFATPAEAARVRAPKAPRHFRSTIEPLAPYVGQTSCDPKTRTGTHKLAELLVHTYPGTTYGTTYACGTDGSRSEHYEGRAIDWMVSAENKHTRAQAKSFIHWLLAKDQYGNTDAMARRLGVMYVIFDNRMWGSWDGRWEDYNNCESKKMQKSIYDNACHRTHVHISLSWNGARAKTSFWTGRIYRTDWGPCPRKHHKYAHKWTKPNRTGCATH